MADSKITALTALTAADPVNDMFPIVDVSDTTMAASGTTKRISANNILSSSPTASGALTVTGLVTAGSATITGALTVDTTTLVVNPSGYADRVGIGTATPTGLLALNQASGAYSLNMDGGGYGTIASFGIVNVGVSNNAYIGTVGNNPFLIQVANSTRATFDLSGHFNLANGNVVMATSGKGIDFAATTEAAGMTSELLNDYEEGTWVPTDASGAGLAFTVSNCRYTKVGRSVTIQGAIVYPATANASNATWGGFPFNSSDSFNLSIIYTDTSIANLTYISSNGTNAFLLTPGVNTLNSTVSGKYIAFSGTYMI